MAGSGQDGEPPRAELVLADFLENVIIKQHLEPNAKKLEPDFEIRETLKQKSMVKALQELKLQVEPIFKLLVGVDCGVQHTAWLQFLRRSKLIGGGGIAVSRAIVIFVDIASEEGDDGSQPVPPLLDKGFVITEEDKVLEFDEFIEAVCTVADVVLPGGRSSRKRRHLSEVVEDLIDKYIVPNIKELKKPPSKVTSAT